MFEELLTSDNFTDCHLFFELSFQSVPLLSSSAGNAITVGMWSHSRWILSEAMLLSSEATLLSFCDAPVFGGCCPLCSTFCIPNCLSYFFPEQNEHMGQQQKEHLVLIWSAYLCWSLAGTWLFPYFKQKRNVSRKVVNQGN